MVVNGLMERKLGVEMRLENPAAPFSHYIITTSNYFGTYKE